MLLFFNGSYPYNSWLLTNLTTSFRLCCSTFRIMLWVSLSRASHSACFMASPYLVPVQFSTVNIIHVEISCHYDMKRRFLWSMCEKSGMLYGPTLFSNSNIFNKSNFFFSFLLGRLRRPKAYRKRWSERFWIIEKYLRWASPDTPAHSIKIPS